MFRDTVRAFNTLPDLGGEDAPWLTYRRLDDLESRRPSASRGARCWRPTKAVHELLLEAQVDVNEATGEVDPVVKLIDFHHPESNHFHAINQFPIATPACVHEFIVPDIVLFVNDIAPAMVDCKKRPATCANPMQEAFGVVGSGPTGCRPRDEAGP